MSAELSGGYIFSKAYWNGVRCPERTGRACSLGKNTKAQPANEYAPPTPRTRARTRGGMYIFFCFVFQPRVNLSPGGARLIQSLSCLSEVRLKTASIFQRVVTYHPRWKPLIHTQHEPGCGYGTPAHVARHCCAPSCAVDRSSLRLRPHRYLLLPCLERGSRRFLQR